MSTQTILDNIAIAFEHLSNGVKNALRTQLGDSAQLEERIQACSRLLVQINQVKVFHCETPGVGKNDEKGMKVTIPTESVILKFITFLVEKNFHQLT